jgi:hypothetical protein
VNAGLQLQLSKNETRKPPEAKSDAEEPDSREDELKKDGQNWTTFTTDLIPEPLPLVTSMQ